MTDVARREPVTRVRAGAYLYPWDVVGDPAAPKRIADLGLDSVTLAGAYHAVRAVTPRHPLRRVVTAPEAAVYFAPDERRWAGRRLAPSVATWAGADDSFGVAAGALARAGLQVDGWVVLVHNATVGFTNPDTCVRNAYGDAYGWALCPANRDVVDFVSALAADCAAQPHVGTLEVEACGWYGFGHLSAHDKVGGVGLDDLDDLLMSLCFCRWCAGEMEDRGVPVGELRARVTAWLDRRYVRGEAAPSGAGLEDVVDDLALPLLAMRREIADQLRRSVVAAVRGVSTEIDVLVHADLRSEHRGAFPGIDLEVALADVDGLVLDFGRPLQRAEADVRRAAEAATHHRVVANIPAVAGLHPDARALADRVRRARDAGAGEVRFYHAGLGGNDDLNRIADAVADLRRGDA